MIEAMAGQRIQRRGGLGRRLAWRGMLLFLAAALLLAACDGPEEREQAYLEKGRELFEAGEYQKARLEFKNARQINPKGVEALYYLAQIQEREANWRGAFAAYSAVLAQDPQHVGATIRLGTIYLYGGDLASAATQAETALTLAPSAADAHALAGAVALRENRLGDARAAAETALDIDQNSVPSLSLMSGILEREGAHDEAVAVLGSALDRLPENAALRLLKIALHLQHDERNEIEQLFYQLFQLEPDKALYRINLARLLIAWGRADDAEALLRSAIDERPDDETFKLLLVDFLANQRSFDAAEEALQTFISGSPESDGLRFGLAELYSRHARSADAQEVFEEIAERDPEGPQGLAAQLALARMAFAAGDVERAQDLAERVIEAEPANEGALLLRSRALLNDGRHNEAVADLRAILRGEPNQREALDLLATGLIASGQQGLAVEALRHLATLEPDNATVQLRLIQLLARTGERQGAMSALDGLLQRQPDNLIALATRADLLIADGEFAEAEGLANGLAQSENKARQVVGWQLLGRVFLGQNRYAESVDSFKKTLAETPSRTAALEGLVEAWFALGETEPLLAYLEDYSARTPNLAIGPFRQGQVLASTGQIDAAQVALREAIVREPGDTRTYAALARLQLSQEAIDQALTTLDDGLAVMPGDGRLHFMKASLLHTQRRYDEAAAVYREMLAQDPGQDIAANNLAALIADAYPEDQEQLAEALALAERFQASNNPYYLDTLGWVLYRTGDLNQAAIFLERADQLAAGVPTFLYHLAHVRMAQGQPEAARDLLRQVLEDERPFPERAQAQVLLDNLSSTN